MLTVNFSILFVASGVPTAHSFLGTSTFHNNAKRQSGWQGIIRSAVFRKATVYSPSWEDESEKGRGIFDEYDGDGGNLLSTITTHDPRHAALAANISQNYVASLARLAAAFNPHGHLDMRNIEHVEVLDVDDAHMDIEAVVCEEDGCVTLAVPVNFPHPCLVEDASNVEGDEENQWDACVMGNLDELDIQASQTIRQLEWEEDHHEEVEAAKRELLTLQNSNIQDLHLPDWWVRASEHEDESKLVRECNIVRNIINGDDSRDEIQALATKSLSSYEYYDDWMVDAAAVAAICSTGLVVRASAHRVLLFSDDVSSEKGDTANDNAMMVEIPIPFQERADSPDDLRAKVVGAVAAAADFVEN